MTAMAETGNGNYYFIDNANDIAGMFQKELKGLSQVVAQNVQLKITIPEYVNIEKVYGGKYEQNGRVLTMDLRDVFSLDTKAILIKYRINNNTNSTVAFNTTLVYKPINANRNSILSTKNKQEFTSNYNTYNQHFSEWVMAQEILYQSNEKLEQAMREVDNGNYEQARRISADNDSYLKANAPMVQKSEELQRASMANTVYQDKIVTAESMDSETKKVLQKSTKSLNYQIRGKK